MSGLQILGGQIVITHGARTVATTGGTLLQFLTNEQIYSTNFSFPNANKSQLYQYQYQITRAPGDNFAVTRLARSVVGALPQEWTNTIVLGAAPAGADYFIGRVALTRIAAPSHTWLGQNISPMIPQGVWIGFAPGGSLLVEGAIGITRSMTVTIVGGNLVAILEHSVGPAAGNFNAQGFIPASVPTTSIPPNNVRSGSENVAVGGAAFPVWWTDTAPYYINDGQAFSGGIFPQSQAVNYANAARYGGVSQASYTDPTNYGTTYSLAVRGRFGRRS